MTNILPQQTGLTVNGVIYNYTAVKDPADDMLVHVQNENALDGGYIFRSTDDWSGIPGNTIKKVVPVVAPIQYWGDGSIEVEGNGTVENAGVYYSYSYDTCFENTTDPACPGYEEIDLESIPTGPPSDYKDPLEDELILAELEEEKRKEDEDEKDKDRKKSERADKLTSLERALGATNAALTDNARLQAELLLAMNTVLERNSYYTSMPGGSYEDVPGYADRNLPDNPSALRNNLAQQLLHKQMVDSQYESQVSSETGESK